MSDFQVLDLSEKEYGVKFHFQGCHIFITIRINQYMGTLKIKIFSKYQKNIHTVNYWSNYVIVHEKTELEFQCAKLVSNIWHIENSDVIAQT